MTYQALIVLGALLFAGCSQTTANTKPSSAADAADTGLALAGDPINSTLPGNALGNYIVNPDGTRTYVGDVASADAPAASASGSEAFTPLHDADAAAQPIDTSGEASIEDLTGLETPSDTDVAVDDSASDAADEPASDPVSDSDDRSTDVADSDSGSDLDVDDDDSVATADDTDTAPVDDGWGSSDAADVASTHPEPEPDVVATPIVPPTPSWDDIAGTDEPVEPPPAPRYEFTTQQVYAAAANQPGLSSWTVIPMAHFRRADRHVVIAWPALNSSGNTVDATVVGICLEENGDTLESCGDRWVVRDSTESAAALRNALGGSDYEVLGRSNGSPLNSLGSDLEQLGNRFVSAVGQRNGSAARAAAMEFTQLLPLERVAFDNDVAQLLWMAARYNGRLEHEGTTRNGDTATLTFAVRRSIFRIQTIRATAEQVDGTDRWIVTSYR